MAGKRKEGEGECTGPNPDAPVDKVNEESKGLTPGIVYLSRVPPYMKPSKVRHLFSRHGVVGRVYLQPEGTEHSYSSCMVEDDLLKTEQCRLGSVCLSRPSRPKTSTSLWREQEAQLHGGLGGIRRQARGEKGCLVAQQHHCRREESQLLP